MKQHSTLKSLVSIIEMVQTEMFKRFPGCASTTIIHLWDDDTSKVECRYGDGLNLIHTVTYYDNELVYNCLPMLTRTCTFTETGDIIYVLTPEEQQERRDSEKPGEVIPRLN